MYIKLYFLCNIVTEDFSTLEVQSRKIVRTSITTG